GPLRRASAAAWAAPGGGVLPSRSSAPSRGVPSSVKRRRSRTTKPLSSSRSAMLPPCAARASARPSAGAGEGRAAASRASADLADAGLGLGGHRLGPVLDVRKGREVGIPFFLLELAAANEALGETAVELREIDLGSHCRVLSGGRACREAER